MKLVKTGIVTSAADCATERKQPSEQPLTALRNGAMQPAFYDRSRIACGNGSRISAGTVEITGIP